MNWFESLILGLLQGLTEYLPISSSGHLTIASSLFGIEGEQNLAFTILVHVATVLSTLVILWKEIVWIFKDLFAKQQWNSYSNLNYGTKYAINIVASMIPIGIVGVFFKEEVESLFGEGLLLVGICLVLTALLLFLSEWLQNKRQGQGHEVGYKDAIIIGIAQAFAVLPGLSRSGTTIATGLLCGVKKESVAQFSFLMVLIPILGEALLDVIDLLGGASIGSLEIFPAIVGFVAAFVTGCFACKFMIEIVRRQRLIWFALYCAIVGISTIIVTII